MLETDLAAIIPRLEVPAYLLHGIHDLTVSYELARSYAHRLEAPVVGFYTYADSAHSPVFEEPARTIQILTHDVLLGRKELADRTGP